MKPAVLMGDPSHFQILVGPNPFTRNWLGIRKKVNRKEAITQWHALAKLLTQLGVEVYVLPPASHVPGLVYPANAGFLALSGTFVLSNLIESRAPETPYYEKFLSQLGLQTASVTKRFEGEADFFSFQDKMIFTYGRLEKQRFVWQWGLPPWRRVYGFRSDVQVQGELEKWVPEKEIIPLELVNEAFYHGDTALCSVGAERKNLMVYLKGLSPSSQKILQDRFSLIPLSDEDATLYAANSFYVEVEGEKVLVLPQGVSRHLVQRIEKEGIQTTQIDVSEFWKKGGGSVKCMIGNLGMLPEPGNESEKAFRQKHLYSINQ